MQDLNIEAISAQCISVSVQAPLDWLGCCYTLSEATLFTDGHVKRVGDPESLTACVKPLLQPSPTPDTNPNYDTEMQKR